MCFHTSTYPVIAILVHFMGVGGKAPWYIISVWGSAVVLCIFYWVVVIWKINTLVEPMLVGRVFSPQLTGSTTISDGHSTRIKQPVWISAIHAWNHNQSTEITGRTNVVGACVQSTADRFYPRGGGGGGGGVLCYFHTYVSSSHVFGFKILNFNIFFRK